MIFTKLEYEINSHFYNPITIAIAFRNNKYDMWYLLQLLQY